jgi:hypothetical protein
MFVGLGQNCSYLEIKIFLLYCIQKFSHHKGYIQLDAKFYIIENPYLQLAECCIHNILRNQFNIKCCSEKRASDGFAVFHLLVEVLDQMNVTGSTQTD